MPVSIDARNAGLNMTLSRNTARNVPFEFYSDDALTIPEDLSGRTFTATRGADSLAVSPPVGNAFTVSISVAQTAILSREPFVLTETTGVDQPIMQGIWEVSDRPSRVTANTILKVSQETSTVKVALISGTEFPELVAGDPSELGLVTAGGVTTASLLATMARTPLHGAGQYYLNHSHALTGTQTMSQDSLRLFRVYLSAGTIDRIGFEVTTGVASLVARAGIYTENAGLPFARIAEATGVDGGGSYPVDCSGTGTKNLIIAAVIPKPGAYWLGVVTQAAAGGALRQTGTAPSQILPMPLGTTAPNGANSYLCRRQISVSGALPATLTAVENDAPGVNVAIHYRYSSIG